MPLPEFFGNFDVSLPTQFGLNGLVLICLACWGIWGIFDKKALDHASSVDVLFAMLICQIPQVPIVLGMLSHLHPGWSVSGPLVLYCSLGAIVYAISMVCYVTAMSKADAGYVLG
ncbi:MAG: EamA family transporter, partial [Leptolyngbya sp.]|nr:EamA family transporter [Candidatus Melainabacteria bacterium]